MTYVEHVSIPSMLRRLIPLLVVFATGVATAQPVPSTINYQGRLTDASSGSEVPVSGQLALEFRIYGSELGADLEWSESWSTVDFHDGLFSVLLGSNGSPILPSVFAEGATRYLEVVVDGETMTPRTRIASVGYSHKAGRIGGLSSSDIEAAGIASASIEFFDLPACPPGWSSYAPLEGRVAVGLPVAAVPATFVGTALSDLEDRGHTHGIDPAIETSTEAGGHAHAADAPTSNANSVGGHTHAVNPPDTTMSVAASHLHAVDPPPTNTTESSSHMHAFDPPEIATEAAEHSHLWGIYDGNELTWDSYHSNGAMVLEVVNWTDGMDTAGSGWYPVSTSSTGVEFSTYTDIGSHDHTVDFPSTDSSSYSHSHTTDVASGTSTSAGSHDHNVDILALDSSSGGTHGHGLDLPASTTSVEPAHAHDYDAPSFESSPATTQNVMPYVQLLACIKD